MPFTNIARLNQTFPPIGRTTDATPLVLLNWPPSVDPDSAGLFNFFVIGNDHNLAQAYWEFRVIFRRIGSGPLQGASTQFAHANTAGAAAWTATVAVNSTTIDVTCTGAAATIIDWLVAAPSDALSIVGVFS